MRYRNHFPCDTISITEMEVDEISGISFVKKLSDLVSLSWFTCGKAMVHFIWFFQFPLSLIITPFKICSKALCTLEVRQTGLVLPRSHIPSPALLNRVTKFAILQSYYTTLLENLCYQTTCFYLSSFFQHSGLDVFCFSHLELSELFEFCFQVWHRLSHFLYLLPDSH